MAGGPGAPRHARDGLIWSAAGCRGQAV